MEMRRWTTSGGIVIERLNTLRCNCYVIQYSDAVYLVDTSVVMERQSIERQLKRLGISGLNGIILTHVHTDHVGNAAYFQKKFNCLVYVHAHERTALRDGCCPLPQGTLPFTRKIVSVAGALGVWTCFEPCRNVMAVENGQCIGPGICALHTPGHTKGSMSLILNEDIALVGDAIIHRSKRVYPPFANDEVQVKNSLQKLLETNCQQFLPGHGAAAGREDILSALL